MSKPATIDRHLCHGQDEEEKYKDIAVVNYWWGLRELAAAFDIDTLTTTSGAAPTVDQKKEFAYLQILHYTVYVKLAGAFHQLEQMQRLLAPTSQPGRSFQLRVFEAKEAFGALHADLYEAVCALANQLFTLLSRKHHKQLIKDKKPVLTGLTSGQVKRWLKENNHPDRVALSSMLDNCDSQLEIRHHVTHYGYVPTLVDHQTGTIYIQRGFRKGEILTRFDLKLRANVGGPLVTISATSEAMATALCKEVDKTYRYVYTSDAFEGYLADRDLKLKDSYQPYWERNNTPNVTPVTGPTSGSATAIKP
ncbi:MAG: hypothetical protein ABIK79_15655 [Chloroflexota bacterium]|nr:hypothetical protein [Anaerolineae bacterium]